MGLPVLYNRDPMGQFGSSLGNSMSNVYKEQYQYNLNKSRLNEALGEIQNYKGPNGQSLEEMPLHQQIAIMGKAFLNTPGGSQLMGELAPILQKQYSVNQQAKAQREAIDRQRSRNAPGGQKNYPVMTNAPPGQPSPLVQQTPPPQQQPLSPEQWIGQQTNQAAQNTSRLGPTIGAPSLERSAQERTPRRSTAPDPVQTMGRDEMHQMALDITEASGGQVPFAQAMDQVIKMNDQAIQQNQLLQSEKDRDEAKEAALIKGGNEKFQNQFAQKQKWDTYEQERYHTLYNRYLNQAYDQGLKNSNDVYDYAAKRLQRRIKADTSLTNSITRPNFIKNAWNNLMGEGQKTVNESIFDLRNKITPIIEDGDIDYVRKVLSKDLGFGPAEVKMVINPMSKEQKQYMDEKIPSPKAYYKEVGRLETRDMPFPLKANYKMRVDPSKKDELIGTISESVNKILSTNPNTDLVLMRREFLKKGYDWRSLSEGINKAIYNNPEIKLNSEQEKDLNTLIDRPPQAGLYQIFQNLMFGKE